MTVAVMANMGPDPKRRGSTRGQRHPLPSTGSGQDADARKVTSVELEVGGATIRVVEGDLTVQEVDAVVNAANTHLLHGGGVAAAIADAAGPSLQAESSAWVEEHGPLRDGVAALTTAGDLPARIVIHVAGPVHDAERDDNADRLAAAAVAALDAAASHGARSIAFPAISAGIYGYPLDEATQVLTDAVTGWLAASPRSLDEVRLVGFDARVAGAFSDALRR
jgi:O-acetyl-ADP-ribose deacetylase